MLVVAHAEDHLSLYRKMAEHKQGFFRQDVILRPKVVIEEIVDAG